jgi:hypothetical protein
MKPIELPGAIEPYQWFVVFHRTGPNWFIDWLIPGEFKHVSAFAYCAGFALWLLYNTELNVTRLQLLPHNDRTITALTAYMRDCMVLKVDKNYSTRFGLTSRIGFYCVPAIKHLLGVHCVSPLPDGLYRAILRNGGQCINEPAVSPAIADRPVAGDRAAAGAAIAHR